MIAAKAAPSPARNPRTAAYATQRRRVHTHRSRYRGLLQIGSVLSAAVLGLLLYVTLTANVTGLNYAIGHAERDRAQLTDEVQRLDDRIAHLESRERLSLVAAKLGMRESAAYTVVLLPQPVPRKRPSGLAFLGWLRTP